MSTIPDPKDIEPLLWDDSQSDVSKMIILGVEGSEIIGFPYYVDFVSTSLVVLPKIFKYIKEF